MRKGVRRRSLIAKARILLENQLHGKLNLPGRARITDAAACGGDHAESRGAHGPSGLGEIRVVEEIEELGAELDGQSFPDLHVLDQGEIKVVEAGANDPVAAETPKDRSAAPLLLYRDAECRRIEPKRRVWVGHSERADLVRTARGQPSRAGGRNIQVHRIAGLERGRAGEFPALHQGGLLEGEVVAVADVEVMPRVEVRITAVVEDVGRVLDGRRL